jgi:hypothetical protein
LKKSPQIRWNGTLCSPPKERNKGRRREEGKCCGDLLSFPPRKFFQLFFLSLSLSPFSLSNPMALFALLRATVPIALLAASCLASTVCNVMDFGARGDNATEDTASVQAAILHCARAGGQVVLPAGKTFYLRPIELQSGVTLRVDGAMREARVGGRERGRERGKIIIIITNERRKGRDERERG